MKNIISLILSVAVIATSLIMLNSCKKNSDDDKNLSEDVTTGLANPWDEADAHAVYEAFSFRFGIPNGAESVQYFVNKSAETAEMRFVLAGVTWTARMTKASENGDNSGMHYAWASEKASDALTVEGTERYNDSVPDEIVSSAIWFNAEKEQQYSLSALSTGRESFKIASEIFEPKSGLAGTIPFIIDYGDGMCPLGADETCNTLEKWVESRFFPSSPFEDFIAENGIIKLKINEKWYSVSGDNVNAEIEIGTIITATAD